MQENTGVRCTKLSFTDKRKGRRQSFVYFEMFFNNVLNVNMKWPTSRIFSKTFLGSRVEQIGKGG